jgi:hypothetical protein
MEGLETEAGAAADLPSVHSSLDEAEEGPAQPMAFTWDSRPILTLVPGESELFAGSGLDLVDIEISVEGWTVLSGSPLAAGVPIVLQKDSALAMGPGVVEESLQLVFTATSEDGRSAALGAQALPWRAYALLAPPTWDASGDRYLPWVAAIDPALRAIDGVEADPNAVIDALVAWIYNDAGLSYDTRYGASAYTTWAGSTWDSEEFNLTAFLGRRFGTVVNCTDCAHILLTFANMLGAELSATIILENFDLNYIKAIGGSTYTHCPFGGGGCGFSYHAVTTNDGADTIWDATLALDGDEDAYASPHEELLVQSIPGEEYLDRLVYRDAADYNYEYQGTIR